MKTTETKTAPDSSHASTLSLNKNDSLFSTGKQKKELFFGPDFIQPKLKIGEPNDKYEQEADRVADAVMHMPDPLVQKQSMDEEEEKLQMKKNSSSNRKQSNHTENNAEGLPEHLKAGLESLSGVDLSDVKVHRNSMKPTRLNALAYTQGQDIYVGPGQEKYLPHEGWHVVQQMQRRVGSTTEMKGMPVNNDPALEKEADMMGEKAVSANNISLESHSPDIISQRKCENCSQGDELALQRKSISNTGSSNSQLKLKELETSRSVSLNPNLQMQASETTDNEQKRAEYQALTSRTGAGPTNRAATLAKGDGFLTEDEFISQRKSTDVLQMAGCTPANTALGNNALASLDETHESWRSHVTYRYSVDNENDHLTIDGYVFAKVYYGFWFSWEDINFSATVDLTCQKVNNSCEIAVNERGGSVFSVLDSPASGAISIQTDRRAGGSQMALTIRVGGAVGANSSVSAGVGPASVGVTFPDASISHKMSMGTFIYTCRNEDN